MFLASSIVSTTGVKSYPTLMRVYCNLSFFGMFRISVATLEVDATDETNLANFLYPMLEQ